MNTTHAETAYDSRANRAKLYELEHQPDPDPHADPALGPGTEPVSGPVSVPDEPGAAEVYGLHVEPDGMDSFLLDVYRSRAQAEADRAIITDEQTSATIRPYRVETSQPSRARTGVRR